ncbi:hypothetical protein [Actinomarinicola tropica]|uniref:Uncharacterized protein n=1 Tax=Actinomarinicola tropica TaxID=2789776 RepID=A0A5Q2RRT7_9ACTN|nr:hypothetical protein [Actinomarinicola tropica]QGG96867.1 hypothetical protein GH723_18165 [Actinomarinicola tropica]
MPFRTSPARGLVALVAATLVLAACGDDGSSAEAGPYVDALAEELRSPSEEGELVLPDDSAECFAEGVVEILDAERLDEAGVTPQELAEVGAFPELEIDVPDDAQERIAELATGCFDVRSSLGESFSSALGVDVSCLTDAADEDRVADVFAEQLVTGAAAESTQALLTDLLDDVEPACGEEIFLRTAVAQGALDEEQAACVGEQLDDEVALRAFTLTVAGEQADEAELSSIDDAISGAFDACGVPAPGQ